MEKQGTRVLMLNPKLHQHFQEILYYYLIGVQGYRTGTLAQIQTSLRDLGISGFCLYEIYGPFDVFLRVWLNPQTKQSLETWFSTTPYVRSPVQFEVLAQKHWASGGTESAGTDLKTAIEAIDCETIRAAQNGGENAQKQIITAGLARWDVVSSPKHVKFYTLIVTTNPFSLETLDFVRESLSAKCSTEKRISQVSLYFGAGFAWAMIKGCFKHADYYYFREFIVHVAEQFAALQLRFFTFFIAHWETYESDAISETSLSLSQVDEPGVFAFVPEVYSGQADSTIRQEIRHFILRLDCFAAYRDDDRELVRRLLVARAGKNDDGYLQLLAGWFIKTEAELKKSFGPLVSALGISAEEVQDYRKQIRAGEDGSALGAWFSQFRLVLASRTGERGQRFFSSEYNERSKRVAEFRNNVMHGNFETVFGPDWLARLGDLVAFLPDFREFQDLVADLVRGKSEPGS